MEIYQLNNMSVQSLSKNGPFLALLDGKHTLELKLPIISRSRTNVHYLVFHLTIADTLVSVIIMPLEAAWRFTLQVMNLYTLIIHGMVL